MNMRTKLAISFNWGKINAKKPYFYHIFYLRPKKVGGGWGGQYDYRLSSLALAKSLTTIYNRSLTWFYILLIQQTLWFTIWDFHICYYKRYSRLWDSIDAASQCLESRVRKFESDIVTISNIYYICYHIVAVMTLLLLKRTSYES